MASIGERIKKARLDNGLSQVELADAASVSQPTVANWETGSHAPRQPALVKLAAILNTSPQWILGGAEYTNGHTLAPKQYLNTPIHHVPVLQWPDNDEIENGALRVGNAHDYIAISIEVEKPFALIANDPAMAAMFPIGSAIIFDAIPGMLENNTSYLFDMGGEIILRSWQNSPDRLEAHPTLAAVDSEFTTQRPKPLAKALMTLRRV